MDGLIITKIEKDENQSREQQEQGLAFFLRQRQAPCRDEVYKIRM